jgi:tartrate dehydrogenase/decarboxylase/D-malate dehydrogenase
MFEPVHGSAPDIAGMGVANPIAQIWSGAMMLEHLGHPDAARSIVNAFTSVLGDEGLLTRDLGGTASTVEMTQAILSAMESGRPQPD